jgi:hypothetical protein
MSKNKIIVWLVAAVILGGVVWELNAYFASTMDWPLVVLNAKNDALQFKEENGNYSETILGQQLADYLAKKGAAGQVSFISANNGTEVAVVVTGLSARSCHGLEKHPELVKNFDHIDVENGICAENSTLRFWFK